MARTSCRLIIMRTTVLPISVRSNLTVIQDDLMRRGYVAVPLDELAAEQVAKLAHRWRQQAKAVFAHADALEKHHHSSIAF